MGRVPTLNAWDRKLLDKHLGFYEALRLGKRMPETEAQKHFFQVCLGRERPRTQHEVAYIKYLQGKRAQNDQATQVAVLPTITVSKMADDSLVITNPTDEAIYTVDIVEEAEFEARSSWARYSLETIATLYRRGVATASSHSLDAAAWATTLLSERGFAQELERWSGETMGTLSNVYTKAIDGPYAFEGLKAGADYVSPWMHRILDHSFSGSLERVRDALPDDTFTEEVVGWIKAFASDAATPAGWPVTTLTTAQYGALKNLSSHFGLPESWLRDALTFTGVELVQSMLPAVALSMNWSTEDSEHFAELCGSLLVGAGIAANPILAIIALAALARAWDQARNSDDPKRWAKGIALGGGISGIVLTTSAAIGGPVSVGIIAGVGLGLGANRFLRATDLKNS